MERTKEYSVVNDTLKALKNQGLSERYFQKGHSFSSKVLLVDLAGIEPASESLSIQASPITVILLTFPPSGAG